MKQRGIDEPGPKAASGESRESKGRLRSGRRLFVLDTNVLMHDPTAIFRFEEHDVYLPMVVLEELDAHKKGLSEAARNVRQVSRFLDDMMRDASKEQIDRGLALPSGYSGNHGKKPSSGRLFFQTRQLTSALPESLPGQGGDNAILAQTLALQNEHKDARVILVSKDINLRIKAAVLACTPRTTTTTRRSRTPTPLQRHERAAGGLLGAPRQRHGSWQQGGRTFYRDHRAGCATGLLVPTSSSSRTPRGPFDGIAEEQSGDTAPSQPLRDYRNQRHNVWGITARNREQNFALNLLMNPDIDFVTLLGHAGTGKTLLTLAAGLMTTLEFKAIREIIMTRVTVPVGEDIGFLPGTEEEKMNPWMGALEDNLDVLNKTDDEAGEWGRAATRDLIRSRIKVKSLNFMRGRTFINKFLIIDEAQNLTPKQMKTLITRAGPGHQGRMPRQHRADRHALPHRGRARGSPTWWTASRAGRTAATSRWCAASARGWPTTRPTSCSWAVSHPARWAE